MKYLSLLLLGLLLSCPASKEEQPEATKDVQVEEGMKEEMPADEMKDEMAPAAAQKNILTEEVTYTADGVNLKGYLAYDSNIAEKRPGVLVVHEWWGHNDYSRRRAEMLAELGYTALAIDMYGEGQNTEHPEDANKFMTAVFENLGAGEARFNAALDLIKKQPTVDPEKIAAIGYCFGGAIVLHMARIGTDLDGVVSFHGSLDSFHKPEPGTAKAKIMVFHGGADGFVPQEKLDAFRAEMDEAKADYEVVVFDGVGHSFTNPAADKFAAEFDLPLAYNEEADKASWQGMQDFFKKIFAE
ncbi:MAG: dienelactone hydrolase family protein [Thermodesulfobacteriota bacterium]